MKKCPFCAEEIQDEAILCRYCGKMLVDKPKEKWYFKTSTFLIISLCIVPLSPLVLPLLWYNPRFSKTTKVIVSIVVVVLSYILGVMFIKSIKSISTYYRAIFSGQIPGL